MNRRHFLRAAVGGTLLAGVGATCYGFYEAGHIEIVEQTLPMPRLPQAFNDTRIAFLTDIHHGPYTELSYVQSIVRTANLLEPDLILLGGDYSLRDSKYIAPCFDRLAELRAPMGVYGVLGNHDYWHGIRDTHEAFRTSGIPQLTNRSINFMRNGERLHLAGVDDQWEGEPYLLGALKDVPRNEGCLLLSHNPDFAETIQDPRVSLVLSGHTHGGQIVFPGGVAPFVPSAYGAKYLRGVVQAPQTTVYVSRGLGTSIIPARVCSRPEINLITLESA